MILIDYNQVVIANFMAQSKSLKEDVSVDLLRHMILNTLRLYRSKYSEEYGELVICCDSKNYWRKKIFPYYKAARKEIRKASNVDWNTLFEALETVREELITIFPYKTLIVDTAEADDIIGTLVHKYWQQEEKILIISSDKDFMQLQIYPNVEQYSPLMKTFVSTEDPQKFLFEHVVNGDRGDGVPNILSHDATFVNKERQKRITNKFRANHIAQNRVEGGFRIFFPNEQVQRNFQRNVSLVDLKAIPENIKKDIIDQYESYQEKDRSQIFQYFIKNRLKNLMSDIQEF